MKELLIECLYRVIQVLYQHYIAETPAQGCVCGYQLSNLLILKDYLAGMTIRGGLDKDVIRPGTRRILSS